MCYCPTPTLHLNLALTGDGAFLFSLKKTHSVWFISVFNYGDTENVLINHLLLEIPMSYPCHYTNLCPHKPHKHAHTHTHTHTNKHTHTHKHARTWCCKCRAILFELQEYYCSTVNTLLGHSCIESVTINPVTIKGFDIQVFTKKSTRQNMASGHVYCKLNCGLTSWKWSWFLKHREILDTEKESLIFMPHKNSLECVQAKWLLKSSHMWSKNSYKNHLS